MRRTAVDLQLLQHLPAELLDQDATAQIAALASRQVSAVELLKAQKARLYARCNKRRALDQMRDVLALL